MSSIKSREAMLFERSFTKVENCNKYNTAGTCYKLDSNIGDGYYWIYSSNNLFSIVIHDFCFHKDYYLENTLGQYFSISYYSSISGEEFNPYYRLTAGCVRSQWCNGQTYQAMFHKNVPIRLIGIEFTPSYCEEYLSSKYPTQYVNPESAFINFKETTNFPEMVLLLNQIKNYKGTGLPAQLFYEGKAAEAMSLILERNNIKSSLHKTLSQDDIKRIQMVGEYIGDHYNFNLSLDTLSKIACMGSTKLKKTFKEYYKVTITDYIQNKRMGQAEHLLTMTDFTIKEISLIVGYTSTSRFIELFKRNTGLTPLEYRNLTTAKK